MTPNTAHPEQKQYTNDDITVVWKPNLCIHSTKCWHGLVEVFNPRNRPWVNMNGASTERIIAQVQQCPSGALSYHHTSTATVTTSTEDTLTVRVEALPNGPLLIYGTLRVKDSAGNETVRSNTTAFCRCGASGNKPFCDGSHVGAHFQG
jgi:uncharacterized Fe-S cluster protein YjdI